MLPGLILSASLEESGHVENADGGHADGPLDPPRLV